MAGGDADVNSRLRCDALTRLLLTDYAYTGLQGWALRKMKMEFTLAYDQSVAIACDAALVLIHAKNGCDTTEKECKKEGI